MRYKVIGFVRYIGSNTSQEGVLLECEKTKKRWVTLGRYWFKALPGIMEDYILVNEIDLDKFMSKFNYYNIHKIELIFPEKK